MLPVKYGLNLRKFSRDSIFLNALSKPILEKLESVRMTYNMISTKLINISDNERKIVADIAREKSQLEHIVIPYLEWLDLQKKEEEALEMEHSNTREVNDASEMQEFIREELISLSKKIANCENKILTALVPQEPLDSKNVMLEIRQGTGGSEASLWAKDLLNVYMKYCDLKNWKCNIVSESIGESGGINFS